MDDLLDVAASLSTSLHWSFSATHFFLLSETVASPHILSVPSNVISEHFFASSSHLLVFNTHFKVAGLLVGIFVQVFASAAVVKVLHFSLSTHFLLVLSYLHPLSPVPATERQISSEAPSTISVHVLSTSEQAVAPVVKPHFFFWI